MCPVDDTGMNSVIPSTMAMTMALKMNKRSKIIPPLKEFSVFDLLYPTILHNLWKEFLKKRLNLSEGASQPQKKWLKPLIFSYFKLFMGNPEESEGNP